MWPESRNQKAKRLYRELEYAGELPTIFFTGLLNNNIWVSNHHKAYKIEQLGYDHTLNIMLKYKSLQIETPKPILEHMGDLLKRHKVNKE